MQRPEIRQGRGKQDQCSMQGKSFNKWCQAGSKKHGQTFENVKRPA